MSNNLATTISLFFLPFFYSIKSILKHATTLISASKHIKLIPVANKAAKEIKAVLNVKHNDEDQAEDDEEEHDEEEDEQQEDDQQDRVHKKRGTFGFCICFLSAS